MKNILFVVSFLFCISKVYALDILKTYKVDLTAITISGISSGAYMANQMSIAYSKTISGSASIAGGIYWCAQGNSQRAQGECMNTTGNIKPEVQMAQAEKLAASGDIDPLENLAKQQL